MGTKRAPPEPLPPDVAEAEVWREGDQHYRVESAVDEEVVTLQQCTPGGKVLNPGYRLTHTGEQLCERIALVKGV